MGEIRKINVNLCYAARDADVFQIEKIANIIRKSDEINRVFLTTEKMDLDLGLKIASVVDVNVFFCTYFSINMIFFKTTRSIVKEIFKQVGMYTVFSEHTPVDSTFWGFNPVHYKCRKEPIDEIGSRIENSILVHRPSTPIEIDTMDKEEWSVEFVKKGNQFLKLGMIDEAKRIYSEFNKIVLKLGAEEDLRKILDHVDKILNNIHSDKFILNLDVPLTDVDIQVLIRENEEKEIWRSVPDVDFPDFDGILNAKWMKSTEMDENEKERLKKLEEKANTFLKNHQFKDARAIIINLVNRYPFTVIPWSLLFYYLFIGAGYQSKEKFSQFLDEVEELASRGMKHSIVYSFCRATYATVKYMKGDYFSAIEGYEYNKELYAHRKNDTTVKNLTYYLISAKIAMGQYNQVLQEFQEKYGSKFFSGITDSRELDRISECYEYLGETEKVKEIAKHALKLTTQKLIKNPNDHETIHLSGWYKVLLGITDEAIREIETAIHLLAKDSDNIIDYAPFYWHSLARAYEMAENYPEAIKCYEKVY